MSTTTTRITVERFREITEPGDRKQLVDGEIVVTEARFRHSLIQMRILQALAGWSESERGHGVPLTPSNVVIDERNSYGPDALWFAEDGYRPAPGYDDPDRIPDLCVEVRSPSTWRYDVGAKKNGYERGGLPELWLVDGESDSVLVYRRSSPDAERFDVSLELARHDSLISPLLPGLTLPLDELFAD